MKKQKKLVIVGITEFAEIAYEYFSDDSEYEVAAFAVEAGYKNIDQLRGLPVVCFEDIIRLYPPQLYEIFVALTYRNLNRPRKRLYLECKKMGYTCASYISSHAFFWKNAEIGENVFIFEDNTVQYHVKIGNNTILWSGNHIGHSSVIGNDVWLTSHVVVSGFCKIGDGAFIGVNASIGDEVEIAEDVVLGAGSTTVKNLDRKGGIYLGSPARLSEGSTAYSKFNVEV